MTNLSLSGLHAYRGEISTSCHTLPCACHVDLPQAKRQTLIVAIEGVFFTSPLQHYVYGALDEWIPAQAKASYATVQVAIDIGVVNPVCALVFIFVAELLEGESLWDDVIPTIEAMYLSFVYSLVVVRLLLVPFQVYLFNHFPLKWRVLISDVRDLLWVIIASFTIGPSR